MAEQHLTGWGLPSLRRAVAVQWDCNGPSHRRKWPLAPISFANRFGLRTGNCSLPVLSRHLTVTLACPLQWSFVAWAGTFGGQAVVQAADPPSSHS